jgi:tRNA-splicing ligase RtcB (3'-phosphate/5'-hydroxy nucleic acid ligase)
MKIFGREIIDDAAVSQLENCLIPGAIGVLTADAHKGYSMPVGGAIAYPNHISPSGVGFDIGCGNKAVRTNIYASDVDIARVMDR